MLGGSDRIRQVDPTRADFDDGLRSNEIESLVGDPALRVIQTSAPVSDSTWQALNDEFFSRRPDVELRVYGHYGLECDLSFASRMSNVRRFAADSLTKARNAEHIAEIPGLESLSLGIFELESFRVLDLVDPGLTTLRLGATRSKKPDLSPVDRFKRLNVVYIEGHTKNIEVLAVLQDLEDVTLRSVTTPDLEYLRPLDKMWSLDLKLGGISSFSGIEGKPNLKYLELWQIRGLSKLDVLSDLPGLQNLFLQSLPRVEVIPSLERSRSLRRIRLMSLKGMSDFTALETAPGLEEFALIEGNSQDPEQLIPVLRNPSVEAVSAWFGSARKNDRFTTLRERFGKAEFDPYSEFLYR